MPGFVPDWAILVSYVLAQSPFPQMSLEVLPPLMVVAVFIGLLMVIVFAAYLLSRGAEVLAEKWGCNIVGSLLLALVTTLPEYAFVYWACRKAGEAGVTALEKEGLYEMAVGSAVGSCTLLVTLGYGLVILLATSRLSRNPVSYIQLSRATRIDALYLLITGLVALVFVTTGKSLSVGEGLVLTALFFGYVYQVVRGYGKEKSCELHEAGEAEQMVDETRLRSRMRRGIAELIVGGIIVFVCSEPFVESMRQLAELLHVTPWVIAVILGPIASEMPEKLTAYITVLRNGANAELSVCNFIGSKVNHNSLLLAVIPFVAYFNGDLHVKKLLSVTFLVMSGLTFVVSALLARGKLYRWQGACLVASYGLAMVVAVRWPDPL